MSINELEAEVLRLDPKERARLAGKLLESLENLSEAENARLWVEEAQRRDAEMEADPGVDMPAAKVFRDARAKLK
ncbi:MAG: addiction module protein [Nitrospira sp.]|nr:addiction module protein [Nitrospira sp.]